MRLSSALLRLMAAGAAAGAILAIRDLAQQHYLAQGLTRTAVWLLGRGAAVGAMAGGAFALIVLGIFSLWSFVFRMRARAEADPPPGRGPETALFLGLLSAAGIAVAPMRGGPPGGPPYLLVALPAFAAVTFFLVMLGAWAIQPREADAEQQRMLFALRVGAAVMLACELGVAYVWVLARSQAALIGGIAAVTIGCGAAIYILGPRLRLVHDRVHRPLRRLCAGRLAGAVSALVLLAGVGAGAAGYSLRAGAQATARQRGLNVILIGIDTLRLDCATLDPPGPGERDLTPNLRRLAERGVVFSQAACQAPWTLPSFASVLTGLYPEQHGAEHLTSTLAPAQLTLAEVLREHGYNTMSVVSCEYLNAASGLGQGFDILDESQVLGRQAITSGRITDGGLALLESHADEPFFLFLHYFDPHFCYRDHDSVHWADGYDGPLRQAVEQADQNNFRWMINALGPGFAGRARTTAEDRRFIRDVYEEEVAYTDAQIGRLLDHLDRAGLWETTLVIALSDHGEELLERNWCGHTVTLYDELVHVPLILAAPGAPRGAVDSRPAELRSIFATICGFLGVPAPSQPTPAGSLVAGSASRAPGILRSSTRPVAEAPAAGEFIPKYVWLSAVTDGRWKLIRDHLRGRIELFDLEADPGERSECSAGHPEERGRLERYLDQLDAEIGRTVPEGPPPAADEEQRRRLRSLGYL